MIRGLKLPPILDGYRRLILIAVFSIGLLTWLPRQADAQWRPEGVPLCDTCVADAAKLLPDGSGGVFVAWRDTRANLVTGSDVYLQRLTAAGAIAPGWPTSGLGVCVAPESQNLFAVSPDAFGGVLLTWPDDRNRWGRNTYVQRVMASGAIAPGWPLNGAPASQATGTQWNVSVAADGLGGAYAAWEDSRSYSTQLEDVYVQHLDGSGQVVAGWPPDGLPACTIPATQGGRMRVLADDSGGAVVVWGDARNGGLDTYGARLLTDGQLAPGWNVNGTHLVQGQTIQTMTRDEAGGFYLVTATASQGFAAHYFLHRFSFDGQRAAGWPTQGFVVCDALNIREGMRVALDSEGGLLMTWYDYRTPGGEIYASRVLPSGVLAPGWVQNGTRVSDAANYGVESEPDIAADDFGGAYVVWLHENPDHDVFIQHLNSTGTPVPAWPDFGRRVAPTGSQFQPRIAADGLGGAIVVWRQNIRLYAQKFAADGPVPTQLSLVATHAEPDGVQLEWYGHDAAHLEAKLERCSESVEWSPLAIIRADVSGHFRFEDRSVVAGTRYAYRLRWLDAGTERTTEGTWVEVPPSLALALYGLRPNPAANDLDVSFALPVRSPVRIEMLDVTGRQRLVRDLGELSPGRHLLRLGDAAQLEPGIYWLRLTQRGEQRLARGIVIR